MNREKTNIMNDFLFKNIWFGSFSFQNADGSIGHRITFGTNKDIEPTVEDLLKDLEEGTEFYTGWTISDKNEIVDQVKGFSTSAALGLMESQFSSYFEVNAALDKLRFEFQRK